MVVSGLPCFEEALVSSHGHHATDILGLSVLVPAFLSRPVFYPTQPISTPDSNIPPVTMQRNAAIISPTR